jgi:MFS transporter, DHA1 family, multidrug resistance protein
MRGTGPRRRARHHRTVRTTTARAAAVVLLLSFVDVFALLPTVAPHAAALGAGPALLGIVVGAYSAANLPANLVGGVLVDRIGRRRVVLLGLALAVVTVAAYPLAATPGQLVAVRLVHGVAGGVLMPAVFALVGDASGVGHTGRAMGRLGALIGAAAVVAPAAAGLLRQAAGSDAVFLAVAGLLAVGWLVAWFAVVDVVPAARAEVAVAGEDGDVEAAPAGLGRLLAIPPLRRALAATAAMTAAVGVLAAFLPARAEALGAGPATVGALFTAYALAAAATMLGPVAGRVDREGGDRLLVLGLGILAVGLTATSLADGTVVAVASMLVFGAGFGLVFPAATGTTSLLAGPQARGRGFGLFNAAFSVGLAFGPPLTGLAAERLAGLDVFRFAAGLCLLVGVVLLAGSRRRGQRGDQPPTSSRSDGPARRRRR